MGKRNNKRSDAIPKRDQAVGNTKDARRGAEAQDIIGRMLAHKRCLTNDNDKAWYNRYPEQVANTAKLAFATPLGCGQDVTFYDSNDANYIAPGIMNIHWIPTFGVNENKYSAFNVAMLRMFERMRSELQGSISGIEPADLAMYLISVDSLYTLHQYCRKLYGLVNGYSVENWYYPQAMINGMGWEITDLVKDGPFFRYALDQMAIMLAHLCIPYSKEELSLFGRHSWLAGSYFVDSNTARAQSYQFVLDGVYKFDNTVPTGSQCTMVPIVPTTTNGVQYLFDLFMECYNSLAGDEDTGNIAGFIKRVFPNLLDIPLTPDNFLVEPSYSQEVLSEIENLTIIGGLYALNSTNVGQWNITQNPEVNNGAVLVQPVITTTDATFYGYPSNKVLNFHWEMPTPDDVMVATRFCPTYTFSADNKITFTSLGSELVTYIDIVNLQQTGTVLRRSIQAPVINIQETEPNLAIKMYDIVALTQFDWAPIVVATTQTGTSNPAFSGFIADLDVFTTLEFEKLARINYVAMQSEMYVALK